MPDTKETVASFVGPEHIAVGCALARRLFAELEQATRDTPGVTRVAYGEGERIAFDLMRGAAAQWDAEAHYDPAGNLFLTQPGADRSRAIQVGSHLDSVPHGGNYDGAAGVILGLALQAVLHAAGRQPPFDLTTVCLRAEESCWFPHSYIGSKSALGLLNAAVLDGVKRSDTGRTLAEHMAEEGFDPNAVRNGASLIERERVLAHIEPHIEQAPALLAAGRPVGIVTGIRGSFRYREARCVGAYAHSGAMPRALRQDAVLATAELIVELDGLWADLLDEGRDLAVTFGQVSTDPAHHSFSKVAGETRICLDVRSQDEATLALVRERLRALTEEIAERRGTRFDMGPLTGSRPAVMSPGLVRLMRRAAERAGIDAMDMASGAGHDAATFALAGIPTAMLFIRNENGSHNPDEHMDMADFERSLALMVALLAEPAVAWNGL
jgi:N-carbamoyl-L-amino-acid hydrolase